MRRSASPRDAPHRIRSFLPLRLGFVNLANCDEGQRRSNLEHYHQLTYESILHRHDRLSKRSQATLKPTKRGAASISPASGKRGWMASFNCGEGEDRRFNLAHHHQLTYKLQRGVSGNPELAPGSKELAPEGRRAVKILHAGLLLQGLPPASTRKDRRLWERGVAAPDRKAASEARKHRTDGLEIEGAGARGAW